MGICVDQASGSRDGHVIGRALIQSDGQELSQGEGIGESPGNAPLAVEPFEEPDHHDAEVLARSQRWPSEFVVVEAGALSFAETIEPGGVEHLIETPDPTRSAAAAARGTARPPYRTDGREPWRV